MDILPNILNAVVGLDLFQDIVILVVAEDGLGRIVEALQSFFERRFVVIFSLHEILA